MKKVKVITNRDVARIEKDINIWLNQLGENLVSIVKVNQTNTNGITTMSILYIETIIGGTGGGGT